MGCDGGTIPRRDELVRVKKKPEQVIFLFRLCIFILFINVDLSIQSNILLQLFVER